MDDSPDMTTRSLPGAPRKRSNSLPSLGETSAPPKEELKSTVVSPFTLSAHKRKGAKEVAARQNGTKFTRLGQDDDDDESDGPGGQGGDDVVDESFFDLLKTFANLDLPDENKIEQCPLCPLTMPLANFAEHVYECIKQLDPEEKKEQLRLDEQLAHELSGQIDEPEFQPKEQGSACAQGSACRRYDASHHRWFSHPLVACPICTEEFTVFAIDAHVSLCLEMGASYIAATTSGTFESSDTTMNQTSTTPTTTSFHGDAFSALRGDTRKSANKPRKKAIEEDEGEDADDDDGEDEDDLPPLTTPALHAPTIQRSSSLSRSQMKAMAQAVIDQKAKPASKQDVSLVAMLETFRGLGFTKESLSQEINKDKATMPPSSSSSSIISPPPVVFHTTPTPDTFLPPPSTMLPNTMPPDASNFPLSYTPFSSLFNPNTANSASTPSDPSNSSSSTS